jgi:hypothetical protein
MKTVLFILILILPSLVFCQKYEDLNPVQKAYVDSIVQRKSRIAQSKRHNKMVSFSEGTLDDLLPFFSFLINNLGYRTADGTDIKQIETKTGYIINLFKYSTGYNQVKQPLKVVVTCIGNTDQLKSAVIYGSINPLIDIYLDYFEGQVASDRPTQGGLDKTYTVTDEIRLYSDKIIVHSHGNIISGK